jgi:RNA polymerase sigma factor (sigma-70 family)
MTEDDRDLLAAAQDDPVAFDRLFARYGNPVLTYCYYRLETWEEAEDAAQQVFIKAFAAMDGFCDHGSASAGSVRAWLFTIAHNEVLNRCRALSYRRSLPLETVIEVADPGPSPESLAIDADRQARVLRLISHLSPGQRCTIELRLAGLTDREIATVLNRSPGAVRATQFRAIAHLWDLVDEEGGSDD